MNSLLQYYECPIWKADTVLATPDYFGVRHSYKCYNDYPFEADRPEAGWYTFGNEFGTVGFIRADSFQSAHDVWLDEFAPEDDMSGEPECRELCENGESCDCHDIAPNGARTVGGPSFRSVSPYDWIRETTEDEFKSFLFLTTDPES